MKKQSDTRNTTKKGLEGRNLFNMYRLVRKILYDFIWLLLAF